MKNRKKIISFILIGIIVVVVCVSILLWKKANSPNDNYERGENETEFVPFSTEEEEEATDEQDKKPAKSEASDTSEKGKDTIDGTDTEDKNENDSDMTTDNDEQDAEDGKEDTNDDSNRELPFVPF